jgi:hypothetical protein
MRPRVSCQQENAMDIIIQKQSRIFIAQTTIEVACTPKNAGHKYIGLFLVFDASMHEVK